MCSRCENKDDKSSRSAAREAARNAAYTKAEQIVKFCVPGLSDLEAREKVYGVLDILVGPSFESNNAVGTIVDNTGDGFVTVKWDNAIETRRYYRDALRPETDGPHRFWLGVKARVRLKNI